ncbi:Gfo/Idh/MocA family protein [Sutcliffiella cohnii]
MNKIGIIGLGVIGQRLIRQFQESNEMEIHAICDTNEQLALDTANQLGNVHSYTDYKLLIQQPEINLIYIAVPPALHNEISIYAIQHGKHILCEKPLANSLEEAEEMKEKARDTDIIHAIHFPLAYSYPFWEMKKMLNDGILGDVKRATLKMHFHEWPRPWQKTNWIGKRVQGGFVREIMPHYLQILVHFFGNDAKVTYAEIDYPNDEVSSEMSVVATIQWKNGFKLVVDGYVGSAEEEHLQFVLHGTEASVSLENWREFKKANKGGAFQKVIEGASPLSLLSELNKELNGEHGFIINFEEGYYVQKLLEGILHFNQK